MRRRVAPGALAAGALVLALLVAWSPLLLGGDDVRYGMVDHWRQALPNAFVLDCALQGGEVPLWNPLTLCGTPLAAHPGWHPFYPPNLLRGLLNVDPTPMRTHVSMGLLVALSVLLAAGGTWALARDHGLSRPAALVAVLAFVLSAAFTHRVCANHFMKSLPWLPLVLLGVRRALYAGEPRRAWRAAVGGGLALGMLVVGGPPQIVFYTAVLLCVYAPLLAATRAGGEHLVPGAARLALLAGIGVAVGAVVLLPASELAGYSARAIDSGLELRRRAVDLTPAQAFRFLTVFPGDLDDPDALMASLRRPRFAGLGALLLALAALLGRRRREVLPLAVVLYVLVDVSLGPPLPFSRLVDALAPYQMGSPDRAAVLACLPLGLLAGLGLDTAASAAASRGQALRRWAAVGLGALLLLGAAPSILADEELRPGVLVALLPAGVLVVSAARLARGARLPQALVAGALALCVGGELAAWNVPYVDYLLEERGLDEPEEDADPRLRKLEWRRPADLRAEPEPWTDNRRGTSEPPNQSMLRLRPAMNGYDPLYLGSVRRVICGAGREDVYTRHVSQAEVTASNARGFLFLKRSFWLARRYVAGPLPAKHALFPPTTTVFLPPAVDLGGVAVPRIEAEDFPRTSVAVAEEQVVARTGRLVGRRTRRGELFELSARLPRRHSALRVDYTASQDCTVEVVLRDDPAGAREDGLRHALAPGSGTFEVPLPDWRQVFAGLVVDPPGALVPEEVRIASDRADEDRLIRVVERRFNSVTLDVGELPGDRILLVVDADYPGWEARVDGEPARLLPANEAFKALALPAGAHRVELAFRPGRVRAGLALSAAAALGSLVALALLRPRANRDVARRGG